jgi:hypothetical protein
MKTTIIRHTWILAFAATLFLSLTSSTSATEWQFLGAKTVNYGLDRDVITVGLTEDGYKRLKVVVRGGGLNMHKMEVVYGNGTKDLIPLRYHFRKRSESKIIDLEGSERIIQKIVFWYDTKNIAHRRARVVVYGGR